MAVLLAILASLDTVQVFVTGPEAAPPPAFCLWTMFVLAMRFGSSAIAFGDLIVIAAIGEHWRRRGGSLAWSVLPGVVGLGLVDAFSALVYGGNLPLLPFVMAGWLVVEAAALAAGALTAARRKAPGYGAIRGDESHVPADQRGGRRNGENGSRHNW